MVKMREKRSKFIGNQEFSPCLSCSQSNRLNEAAEKRPEVILQPCWLVVCHRIYYLPAFELID